MKTAFPPSTIVSGVALIINKTAGYQDVESDPHHFASGSDLAKKHISFPPKGKVLRQRPLY